ncbi:MAG: glycosyltransferase family 87 protein, partial [Calditrichota bacterium]
LFKGSWLALAAGQMSLPVIFLLIWFYANYQKNEWLSLFALAIATLKPTLAAPFFLYLLLRGEFAKTFTTGGIAFFIHLAATLIFPAGPVGYLDQLVKSLSGFEIIHVNSYLLMGTSGRIDLAPLAAVFGVQGVGLIILLSAVAIGGLYWLYRNRHKLDDLTSLLLLNILFFLLTYHRAYDLVLLLILGVPVLWRYSKEFSHVHLLALLPLAMPLQFLLQTGLEHLPQLTILWHLFACSVPVTLAAVAVFLLLKTKVFEPIPKGS